MENNQQSLRTAKIVFILISILFTISVGFSLVKDDGEQNLHVHQARAFVHGELDIDEAVNDVAIYDDRYYVPFPPFPAILIVPVVALVDGLNTTLFALLLTVLLFFVLQSLFRRIGLEKDKILWLIMAFIFGTGYWFVTKFSFGVWSFAHVVAVVMLFLTIREAFGKKRAWVMALFLGCAFLSRQMTIYSSFFLLAVLADKAEGDIKTIIKEFLVFGLVLVGFICLYLYLNYLRFDDPLNTGYAYIAGDPLQLLGDKRYGLFHYKYFTFNFIYMFLQGPHISFDGLEPTTMDLYGTSLTFASPFVFFIFRARARKLIKAGALVTIGISLCHMLFYCNNGWVQVNTQRFTLDFLPIVMVLVAMGVKDLHIKWLIATVCVAIFLNILAFIGIPVLS